MPVLVHGGGVAIVAIGRVRWVLDVDRGEGKGERRLKLGISSSADHRVVEAAVLAAFVETWQRWYGEQPERMIAEGI
jgi:2-oxoisovalerate dehydrogenase E2 component (dihydrolipoyl transacylase)